MSFNLQLIFAVIANAFTFSHSFDVAKFNNRLYYIDNSRPLSWTESVTMCMEKGLQMVTPNTQALNDFLKTVTHRDKDYWLNAKKHTICEEKMEHEHEHRHLSHSNIIHFGTKSYHFYEEKGISFFEAYKLCREDNLQLAITDNEQSFLQLVYEAKKRKANYWIGLQSYDEYGIAVTKWHWNSTRRQLTYTNWCAPQTHKPNIQYKYQWCAYLNSDEECWRTEVCDRDFGNVHGFVCENRGDKDSIIFPPKIDQTFVRIQPASRTTTTTTSTTTTTPTTTTTTTTTPTTTTTTTTTPTTTTTTTLSPLMLQVRPQSMVSSITTADGAHYYFYESKVSQTQANAICQHNGQNLVTIDDPQIWALILTEVRKRNQNYWIGTESYTVMNEHIENVYWKWNNTGQNILYENWCPNQVATRDFRCSFINAAQLNVCWMFSNCEQTDTITGFIGEDRMNHTAEYDILMYRGYEYFLYNKHHRNQKKYNWYEARDTCKSKNKNLLTLDGNEKIDFFNRVLQAKNMTAWVGLESYFQIVNGNKYMYWRWQSTGHDIAYKYWCQKSKLQKESMCGFITLDPMCWMAEKCTNNDVMSFICEDTRAVTHITGPIYQHYNAMAYHKGFK